MKFNTFRTYFYTADRQSYDGAKPAQISDITYNSETTTINIDLSVPNKNNLAIYSKEPLKLGDRITNITSRDGVHLFVNDPDADTPIDFVFVVTNQTANINPWGEVEFYGYSLITVS